MSNFISLLATALLLSTPNLALACSIFPAEPREVFETSDSLVLAHPTEISPTPEEAKQLQWHYSYQQIVTWKVDKSWKGSLTDGETFVTEWRINSRDPCSGWGLIRDYQPKILRSVAGSSFQLYIAAPVDWAAPQLDALKEAHD